MEEIADCGNADTDAVWVTLDQQPQEVCEGDVNRWGKKKKTIDIKGTHQDISWHHEHKG